jgi:hypothetical protein
MGKMRSGAHLEVNWISSKINHAANPLVSIWILIFLKGVSGNRFFLSKRFWSC